MSRRSLGGGRVLGSGRSISPAVQSPKAVPQRLLSPSTSSVSLNSQTSTSQVSIEPQDLTSRISLDNGDSHAAAAASASARLVCPICNEEMVTLLQLNRHLDDNHKNLEDERQDEVKDWFKSQMVKAKRFQPLAVLNQKLKGLDVFESNDVDRIITVPEPTRDQAPPEPPRAPPPDPDEVVTRKHWQKRSQYDVCSEPMCGRRLTATNGNVNCRHCGKLFCDEHTMYQMKLSRAAQYEPVRGLWCRVCETCYKSRDGYNDHTGFERDHTTEFKAMRKPIVDKAFLEVSRLEKRLSRLTQLFVDPPPDQAVPPASKRWSLSWQKDQRKVLEQSVVTWQDDASVPRCPYCQQDFTSYTFRRHHCRTCGKVVCGDPQTGCSMEVGLTVATMTNTSTEKPGGSIGVDVRLCKDCKGTLFDKKDFAEGLAKKTPDVRAYENLVEFERGIRLLLPKFQNLLVALQDPEKPPTPVQLNDASKIRKRLIDSFAQYDTSARRIRDLATDSPAQQRLQKAVYTQASNFLHLHMLPLKTLPKLLKHATPHGRSPNGQLSPSNQSTTGANRPQGALAAIKYNDMDNSSQVTISSNSSAVSALEAEEKSLRDRLIVLEEQKFFVSEMIADANKRRKFDEVSSLAQNVEDLSKEIDQVNGMLGQLDFAGAYTGQLGEQGLTTPSAR